MNAIAEAPDGSVYVVGTGGVILHGVVNSSCSGFDFTLEPIAPVHHEATIELMAAPVSRPEPLPAPRMFPPIPAMAAGGAAMPEGMGMSCRR